MLSLPLGLLPLAGILIYGKTLDAILLFSFITLKKRDSIQELVSHIDPAIVITSAKTTTTLFILLQVYRYIRNFHRSSSQCDDFPVNPMLFPCETAHVRMFPKKHGFSYSYLLVGIPVGWKGSVGGMISSDVDTKPASWYSRLFSLKPGSAWYTVNGDDYLERGHVEDGLKGKLKKYLEGQVCISSTSVHFDVSLEVLSLFSLSRRPSRQKSCRCLQVVLRPVLHPDLSVKTWMSSQL